MQADAHFEVKRVHSGRILTQRSAFADAMLGVACEIARDGLGYPGISAALSCLASLEKPSTGCVRVRGLLVFARICVMSTMAEPGFMRTIWSWLTTLGAVAPGAIIA
ncbi:hypothetical protein WH06_00505 [Aeromonas salmonicida subsp. salmonicida]|nr:hypothetical protein CE456_14780 [Aeromonas salmonicida]ATD38722.1 hypothetical protein BHG40_12890 [Aeromonas salmonicida subsp. masoucida]OKA77034.1 hypothetical protein BHR41_10815 [Aeromonas salmonicida subsp. salmonicida]ASI28042.1 hypothetical protein CE463_14805 [Aeromonas salmonicida]ASI32174.1 hypothetical protein CE462_13755 [Aeromonas salmonicida]